MDIGPAYLKILVCYTTKIAEPWGGLEFLYSDPSHFVLFWFSFFSLTVNWQHTTQSNVGGPAKESVCGRSELFYSLAIFKVYLKHKKNDSLQRHGYIRVFCHFSILQSKPFCILPPQVNCMYQIHNDGHLSSLHHKWLLTSSMSWYPFLIKLVRQLKQTPICQMGKFSVDTCII